MAAGRIQPGAGAATPPAAATHTLPALSTDTGPAVAGAPVEQGCSTGTRGGICSNCGERADHLVPSLNGAWMYCMDCAEEECREEAPAAPEEDGDNCAYLYPDPDEQREEWLERRKEAQR